MLHEVTPNARQSASDAEVTSAHWNDQLLVMSGEHIAFKEGVNSTDLQASAEEHLVNVWEQEQALLELAVAKIEGREAGTTEDDVQRLGITNKVMRKSSSLVNELYLRMGAANDMERSDLLLTGLAGLIVDEVASESIPGFGDDYKPTGSPVDRSFAVINAFTSRLGEQPELIDGKEREMLLAAELLSEALRAPNSVRSKLGTVAGVSAESLDGDFYAQSVVQICDAITRRLGSKNDPAPEGLSGKRLKKFDREQGITQSAVLTKYDTLFDMLEANPEDSSDAGARHLLKSFIKEASPIMQTRHLGYAYELFAPLMFRYAALQGGALDTGRIWHAPARADTPKDGLGSTPNVEQQKDPRHVAQHLKKQSADAFVGKKSPELAVEGSTFGSVSDRLQLKARDDADAMAQNYDEKLVGVLSEDMANLLTYLDDRFNSADSVYGEFPTIVEAGELSPQEIIRGKAASQVMLGAVIEIGRRLGGPGSQQPDHEFGVKGASTEITVDIPDLLDRMILPVYQRLVESTAGKSPPNSERAEQLISV